MNLCNFIENRGAGQECRVQVWVKYFGVYALDEDVFDDYIDANLDYSTYYQLTPDSVPISTNGEDFREHIFDLRTPPTANDPTFGAFVVKIVLLSTDGRFVPKVKNLRIIAT